MTEFNVKGKVSLDVSQMQRASAQAQNELKNIASSAAGSAGAIGRLGAAAGPAGLAIAAGIGLGITAITALSGAVAKAITDTAKFGSTISDLSAKTGLSTDSLQKMGFAGAMVGVSMESIAGATTKMQKKIVEGGDAFRQLGLDMTKLKAMSPEDQFTAIGTAIGKIKDPAQQSAAAMEIFGKSGAEMLPLFKSNLAGVNEEFEKLGLNISENGIKAADDFDDATTKLGLSWDSLIHHFGAAALDNGAITGLTDDLTADVSKLISYVEAHKEDIGAFFQKATDAARGTIAAVEKLVSIMGRLSDSGLGKLFKYATPVGLLGVAANQGFDALAAAGAQPPDTSLPELLSSHSPSGTGKAPTFDPKAAERLKKAEETRKQNEAKAAEAAVELRDRQSTQLAAMSKMMDQQDSEFNAMPGVMDLIKESNQRNLVNAQNPGVMNAGETDIDKTTRHIKEARAASQDWAKELQNVANAFQAIPGLADSGLGKILAGTVNAASAAESVHKSLFNSAGNFKGVSHLSASDIMGTAAGGIQALGGVISSTRGKGGAKGALSGGAQGAAFGSQFGLQGAAIGAGVGALVGLFSGLSKTPAQKAGEAAAKTFGNGFKASKELSDAIVGTMKETGGDSRLATLLHTSDAIKESGKDARLFAGSVNELMEKVFDGSVPASEGIAQIGDSFTQVASAALKAGSVGDKAMVSIIKRARELGQDIPQVKEFVSSQLSTAAGGVGVFMKNLNQTSDSAVASATIFSTAFWATVKEKGFLEAADAFKGPFEQLSASIGQLGLDPAALLGGVGGIMDLANNDVFRGAAESARGLDDALKGIANSGYMTADSFGAFGTAAQAAYAQAMEGGASQAQALTTIGPLLSDIVSTGKNYGMTIDANTQALIDQAKQAGVAFPTDPIDKMAESMGNLAGIMSLIAEKMGVSANELERFASTAASIPSNIGGINGTGGGAPGNGGFVPPAKSGGDIPEFADGGVAIAPSTGGLAMLHGREMITPMNGGGGGGAMNVTVSPTFNVSGGDAREIVNQISELVERGLVPQLLTALNGR